MINLSDMTARLKGFFRKDKDTAVKIIVGIGILGMLLILFGQLTGSSDDAPDDIPENAGTAQYTSDEYADRLEEKVRELVMNIDGVGEAQVMITLENGVQYVYAQEEKSSTDKTLTPTADGDDKVAYKQDTQTSYVMVDTDYGRKQALVTTQLQPKVQGVIIVCEGADNVMVQQNLISVVTTALNIPSTRVCVVKINEAATTAYNQSYQEEAR